MKTVERSRIPHYLTLVSKLLSEEHVAIVEHCFAHGRALRSRLAPPGMSTDHFEAAFRDLVDAHILKRCYLMGQDAYKVEQHEDEGVEEPRAKRRRLEDGEPAKLDLTEVSSLREINSSHWEVNTRQLLRHIRNSWAIDTIAAKIRSERRKDLGDSKRPLATEMTKKIVSTEPEAANAPNSDRELARKMLAAIFDAGILLHTEEVGSKAITWILSCSFDFLSQRLRFISSISLLCFLCQMAL